ncbi:MAG TPA: hypothetical protein PKY87_00260 [Terricaulis sp.]|nr:hypothetical protein [Terricaulis sp.]
MCTTGLDASGLIEMVDAEVERRVDHPLRAGKVHPAAEIVAAEPDRRDPQPRTPHIDEVQRDLPAYPAHPHAYQSFGSL